MAREVVDCLWRVNSQTRDLVEVCFSKTAFLLFDNETKRKASKKGTDLVKPLVPQVKNLAS